MFIPDALAVELRAAVVKVGALVEPWGNVCRDLDVACIQAGIARVSPAEGFAEAFPPPSA